MERNACCMLSSHDASRTLDHGRARAMSQFLDDVEETSKAMEKQLRVSENVSSYSDALQAGERSLIVCPRQVAAEVYGKEFEGYTTFRWRDGQLKFYIRDESELQRLTSKLLHEQRMKEYEVFLFFLRLCRKTPLPPNLLLSREHVETLGVLAK